MKPLTRYEPSGYGTYPMKQDPDGSYYAKDEADARIREIEAERDAARADAERYRWLKPKWMRETTWDRYEGARWDVHVHDKDAHKNIDAAIDAARGKE